MSNLEQFMVAMRLEQKQRMTSFQQEQEQHFNKLERMIASLARGKSTFLEGDSSSQATPGSTFQTIPPAANALVVDEFPMAIKKIELPNCDGLARAEQYFSINKTTDEMKVELALNCMEGPAPSLVQSMGVYHDVKINLGNLEIFVDCYVFPLGGVDLILGVAWLATLEQHITTPAKQKWGAKLLGYDFKIIYKPRSSNVAVDALSRREEELELQVVYGRESPTLHQFLLGETKAEAMAQELATRDELLRQLAYNLSRAQQRMVKAANKNQREVVHSKLATRYFGPFTINKKVVSVAYKLQLPEHARIHPVFHVSQLKRVIGQHQVVLALPKELEVDEELIEPEDVLQHRISTINGNSISQLLTK
ncbi:hypothetical protein GH714_015074 [Hevea brasiliensis]|uniref:Tf2-1-like SH3-like domain-containing protein n=1 Tax=Hevea brasiliensis TaxID=3981 RepID=A0A6A6LDE3_HEVBR|nr:hypothetical protein GH714_015074 [Hevea brasiliensis]